MICLLYYIYIYFLCARECDRDGMDTARRAELSQSMITREQRHRVGEGGWRLSDAQLCVQTIWSAGARWTTAGRWRYSLISLEALLIFVVENKKKNTRCMMKLKRSHHHKAIITTGQKSIVCLKVTFLHGSGKLSLRSHIQDHLLNSST